MHINTCASHNIIPYTYGQPGKPKHSPGPSHPGGELSQRPVAAANYSSESLLPSEQRQLVRFVSRNQQSVDRLRTKTNQRDLLEGQLTPRRPVPKKPTKDQRIESEQAHIRIQQQKVEVTLS